MTSKLRDAVAVVIAVVAIFLGGVAAQTGRIEPGLDLRREPDGTVVVSDVWPAGTADIAAIHPGMVVEFIGQPFENGGRPADAAPPAGSLDPAPLGTYWFRDPATGATRVVTLSDPSDGRLPMSTQGVVWAAIAMLVGAWLRIRPTIVPEADSATVRRLALPTAAALAIPIALVPWYLTGSHAALWSLAALPVLGIVPLVGAALGLSARRIGPLAWTILLVAALSWLAAVTLGVSIAGAAFLIAPAAMLSAVLVTIGAAIVAPEPPIGSDFEGSLRRAIRTFDLTLVLGAAVSGIVALALSTISPGDWADVARVWLVFVAFRLVVVPFIVAARRARSTRDSTLDAVETERVRISSEIHDDVIQDLTMLVRRLDAASDRESATIAREAAGRLREITGDARLPVLDDLGVAAALDWLVRRMSAIDGGTLKLSTDETARPPRTVEVAMFRVAQEALANALRHGAAPVTVRYRSATDRAMLEVVDSGAGIAARAEEIADGAGRLGIAGMRRRAAAIDATLRIDRVEEGGTCVRFVWGVA
jgi:signal transduction histidine kinase